MKNILSKYQKHFLIVALILSSLAVSIRFGNGQVNLILQEYPVMIFLMVVVSSFLVVLYIQLDKSKISTLSSQIKELSEEKSEEFDAKLKELTARQKEVYDLIVVGKTNKEIISELFIEQSTLKSHINQIYKKLNIKSRRELKSKLKR